MVSDTAVLGAQPFLRGMADEHLAKLAMMAREAPSGSPLQDAYVSSVNAIVVSGKGFVFNPPLIASM